MLKIWGKLWVRDKVVKSYTVENVQRTGSLEACVKSALPEIIGYLIFPCPSSFLPTGKILSASVKHALQRIILSNLFPIKVGR